MIQDLGEGSEPQPQGRTPQDRPRLEWQLTPAGRATIRRASFTLNGKAIPTRYDVPTATVIGEPVVPVPLGLCQAHGEVWLSTDKGIDIDWTFTRVPVPPPAPPPDSVQRELVAQVNQFRRLALLPEASLDAALCLAAARHSRYLQVNRLGATHDEDPQHPAYYGKTPEDRAERAGCFLPCYEVISGGSLSRTTIQALLDAPYHRSALLQPGHFRVGAGRAGDTATVLCSLSTRADVVVYPTEGQLDVPLQWQDTESPDPLRLYPHALRTTGYPITLHFFGPQGKLELKEAQLLDPTRQPVACYANAPDNDDALDDTLILIPHRPLLPETTYSVRFLARSAQGTEIARAWQFTTTKAPPSKKK